MKTDLEVLEGTLSRLRTTGWRKDSAGDADGPNCLSGALTFEMGWSVPNGWPGDHQENLDQYDRLQQLLRDIIGELFPEMAFGVIGFNDGRRTDFVHVEQVLEKTIVQLQEAI